jgi:hypothetical protein
MINSKIIGKFLFVLIPIVAIVLYERKVYLVEKIFFKNKLNTVVVDIENNWSGGRSYNYITKNHIVFALLNYESTNLRIGDSIVKEKNSWEFDVFRYDSIADSFYYYKKYDKQRLNR